MTTRLPRIVAITLVATCLAFGSGLVGPTLGTDSATTVDPVVTGTRSPGALPAPFAQAGGGDGEVHVVNITTSGEPIEYTLTAPSLTPENDVDLVDDDGNETNQDVVRGNSAAGFIGNGNYDAYAFAGSIDTVRLESDHIDDIDVTIDGESIDPRTLSGEGETETTMTTATTAEPTTAEPTTTRVATETTGTEETHVIDVSAPGDNVEYTLTAPGLEPTDSVEVGENAAGAANPETVRGDTAFGTIGNGAHDAYRFAGSVDAVRLESDDIDELDVTIDDEPVDPRTFAAEETETAATTETTAARETATESTGPDTTETPTATASGPTTTAATTTATAGAESGQSGFGIVMFVLIGIVSGLVLAAALVYVVGSDRSG